MRFVSLSVCDFRAIRRLDVEFGAGINVLYGPNDLGKSTVAAAIRAALLVPPSGSVADSYESWFSGMSPRVELTLVDAEGHWWKVKKTFSSASASSAELFHSKDGLTFALDCRAREVEERLRTMLAWGIPAPGGRGAPRGMPDSFIAQSLLGGQDDADDILEQSLAKDAAESGKLRLTKALASLAQDPLFKSVLLRAQGEVDQFFTATGQRKRGQGSRFAQAGERVRVRADELRQLKVQLETSTAIESEAGVLRQRFEEATAVLDEANAVLQATRERRARGVEREAWVKRAADAKRNLEDIDAQRARLAAMERDVEQAKADADARKTDLAASTAAAETREAEWRATEEAVRLATGDKAVGQREIRKAKLEKRAAELAGQLTAVTSNGTTVGLAIQARDSARAAASAEATAVGEFERATADRKRALEDERKGAVELETSRALLALVRWRNAIAAREDSAKAQNNARRAEADAAAKDEEATKIELELANTEKGLATREATLPTPTLLQRLRDLERELEKAEAALGGGIDVVVRPRRPLDVTARLDGNAPASERLADVRSFAAERALRLTIDDVAEFEITAGSADARSLVESLRQRWTTEAVPALEKAGVAHLTAVVAASEGLQSERTAAANTRRSAQQARAEAKGLREQAALHRERAGVAPMSEEEVGARRAAIGDHDLAQLEAHYDALQRPPEARAEQLHEELGKSQLALQGDRTRREEQVRLAEFALAQARKRSREAEETHRQRVASLPPTDLDVQKAGLAEQLVAITGEQAKVGSELSELAVAANRDLERAQQAHEKAIAAHNAAKDTENKARAALEQARERCSSLEGANGELRATVQLLDRAAAEATWKEATSTLASIPQESVASAEDLLQAEARVASAQQRHSAAREELFTREGALAHVGGAALREEVERLEEARSVAEDQQRALEIDADAWKLLRDTLRTVENEEGAHLGRALAGPVGTRFAELTAGRYRDLRLDVALKAEGLTVAGAAPGAQTVLEALSVGTRSQLAALIRLTIADQLQSAIVLDDHLVHTDVSRLAWFHDFLRKISANAQVVVITCRPQDYLAGLEVSAGITPVVDLAGGVLRAIDLERVLQRHSAPTPG